jgi:hypothetical protein
MIHRRSALKFLHLEWNDVNRLSKIVADEIRGSNFLPDIIVAISRGGFAPARVLCDHLDIMNLASVKIEYYTGINERKSKPVVVYPLNADVKEKRVLISDDVADTGRSLFVAKKHVLKKKASDVKLATLHHKPWSLIKPDFYGETVDAWVVYPWEEREAVKQLISKMKRQGSSTERAVKQLIKEGFKESTLRELGLITPVFL